MLPDIRQVIESLLGKSNTLYPNNKKSIGFQWLGLRQSDYSKKCACNNSGSTSSGPCSRCYNTGYLFTDFLVKGYAWLGVLGVEFGAKPGMIATQQKNVVLEHNRPINKFDYILELDQNPNTGKILQPFKIIKYYRIQDAMPIKGDIGRVEYWKCNIEERNVENGIPNELGTDYNYRGNRSNNEPQ